MNPTLLPPLPRLVRLRHVPDDDSPARGDGPARPAPAPAPPQARPTRPRTSRHAVLHLGCGRRQPGRLHPLFSGSAWDEIRVDVDPAVQPDIVASLVELGAVEAGSAAAIWCSHSLEHLSGHEVAPALAEFRRVLAGDGMALIRSPDMDAVLDLAAAKGLDHLVYHSPAGPVTVLDMIYGHGPSVAQGTPFMRHGTGFTEARLARVLAEAGFGQVFVGRTSEYEVWGAAFMPEADPARALRALARRGVRLASRPSVRRRAA